MSSKNYDEHLLNGDEDDLDYDLDETEEALLLDDNDDDNSEEPEEDSTEVDVTLDQSLDFKSRREGKFVSERKTITAPITNTSNDIPDNLDKVSTERKFLQDSKDTKNQKQNFRERNKTPFNMQHRRKTNFNRHFRPKKLQNTVRMNPGFACVISPWENQQNQFATTHIQQNSPWATTVWSGQFMPGINGPMSPLFSQSAVLLNDIDRNAIPQNTLLPQNRVIPPNDQLGIQHFSIMPHVAQQNPGNQLRTLQDQRQLQQLASNQTKHFPTSLQPVHNSMFPQYAPEQSVTRGLQQGINVSTHSTYNNKQTNPQNRQILLNTPNIPFHQGFGHNRKIQVQSSNQFGNEAASVNTQEQHKYQYNNKQYKRHNRGMNKHYRVKNDLNSQNKNLTSCNTNNLMKSRIQKIEVPDSKLTELNNDTNEDEELLQYQKKIEEQKKKREEVLLLKEKRRKTALAQENSASRLTSMNTNKNISVAGTKCSQDEQGFTSTKSSLQKKNLKNLLVDPDITTLPVSSIKIMVPNDNYSYISRINNVSSDNSFIREGCRKVCVKNDDSSVNNLTVTTSNNLFARNQLPEKEIY